MSTTLLYGLILAAGNILLTLAGYFMGYQTDRLNDAAWLGFLPFILSVVVLWFGIRAVREENQNFLTYGQGVKSGMLIAAYGSALMAIYVYAHFTFINPAYPDYVIAATRAKAVAQNLPAENIEAMEKLIRTGYKPVFLAASTLIFSLLSNLIISLISAAFLKQPPPPEQAA